jgi:hypothetical protein
MKPMRHDMLPPYADRDLINRPPVPGSCDPRLIVKGPLSTPLTIGDSDNTVRHKQSSLPSWEWGPEEIEREELRVRAAFMRASVDHRKRLKEMSVEELEYYQERERGKVANRRSFESKLQVCKVYLPLHKKDVFARHQKESKFLDDKIAEMTQEANRMKVNLEQQVVDFNRLVKPTLKQVDHIVKVKTWLQKFPQTMSNLERSQGVRRLEVAEQRRRIEAQNAAEEARAAAAKEEDERSQRKGAAASAGKRQRAIAAVKQIVGASERIKRQRITRLTCGARKGAPAGGRVEDENGVVWLSEIGARFWGVVDVANEV